MHPLGQFLLACMGLTPWAGLAGSVGVDYLFKIIDIEVKACDRIYSSASSVASERYRGLLPLEPRPQPTTPYH